MRPSLPRLPYPAKRTDVWSWLGNLIGGPVIAGLINAHTATLEASNTNDRIATDLAAKEIEGEIEARKQASAIIIAVAGTPQLSGRCSPGR